MRVVFRSTARAPSAAMRYLDRDAGELRRPVVDGRSTPARQSTLVSVETRPAFPSEGCPDACFGRTPGPEGIGDIYVSTRRALNVLLSCVGRAVAARQPNGESLRHQRLFFRVRPADRPATPLSG